MLSLPAMAILACAVVLLVRDEVANLTLDYVWNFITVPVLTQCVNGSSLIEDGWWIQSDISGPKRSMLSRIQAMLAPRGKASRALRLKTSDDETFVLLWNLKPIPLDVHGHFIDPKGIKWEFSKQMFVAPQ